MYSVSVISETFNSSEINIPADRKTRLQQLIVALAVLCVVVVTAAHLANAQSATLHSFQGNPDGANPESRLTLYNGNLYGTTFSGGLGFGTVFELTPNAKGGWHETVLYNFCSVLNCADGANPTYSYVLFDNQGNLYGTAYSGGTNNDGVVFELSPSGGIWTEQVLYSFANMPDGANPINGLVADAKGHLYGTTYAGGSAGNGSVFQLTNTGSGWTEKVIFNMSSTYAGLVMDSSGDIFGTTYKGVFELSPTGTGTWHKATIFAFTNSTINGYDPNGTLVLDSAGNLYGTTYSGGAHGFGTVYELISSGTGTWTENVLWNFQTSAAYPLGGVILDASGNIYGTTSQGGHHNDGTVYELVRQSAGGYQEKTLLALGGGNGNDPFDSLIMDSKGYLYGTTYLGGSTGNGIVLEVNPSAAATTITLTSSQNPSTSGEAVTFTATVTSPVGPPPNGANIVFEPLGQAPLSGGVATFTTSALNTGTTNVRAVFSGDLNFLPSNSDWLAQQVNP
jgi:uncharacterized repeat protein (TIGR03803 family)